MSGTVEITLVCATTAPMSWTIEAVNCDGDGGIAVALFSGPEAESCARQWCAMKYGEYHPRVMVA
jgi:hypothetical protein